MAAYAKDPPSISNKAASPVEGAPSHLTPRLTAEALKELRALLISSGYCDAQELLNEKTVADVRNPPFQLHLLRRLFGRGETLSLADAEEAIEPMSVGSLVDAGLLEQSQDRVRAAFQIQVYDGLLFIVDFMPHDHPADLVLPIGPSGKYLASLTIRQPVNSALDLGCGCGIQALLIARHAGRVTATDINPRALELTRLNADFNGIANIELLQGSYFEPVRGRTFDLIVANLPYVITPDDRYIYRDLGHSDDVPIRHNVEQMAEHLNEGGFAQVMLNWIHGAQEAWWRPVEGWTARRNVDAWLIYSSSKTPEEYADQWMNINATEQPEAFARTREHWLAWYQRNGIERIAFGALTMRRRSSGNNWRCSLKGIKVVSEPLGGHIQQLFAAQDAISQIGGLEGLMEKRLRLWSAAVEPARDRLFEVHTLAGFRVEQLVHAETARAIAQLNGKMTLSQAMTPHQDRRQSPDVEIQRGIAREIYELMNVGLIELVP